MPHSIQQGWRGGGGGVESSTLENRCVFEADVYRGADVNRGVNW